MYNTYFVYSNISTLFYISLHILMKKHLTVQKDVKQKQKDYRYVYTSNIVCFKEYLDAKNRQLNF